MTDEVRELTTRADVLAASADHAFLRFDLSPDFDPPALLLVGSTTVAWSQRWPDGRVGALLVGDPDAVTVLVHTSTLHDWLAHVSPSHVTTHVEAYAEVAPLLGLRAGNAWDRMWTTTPPPPLPAVTDVRWHDGSRDELTDFVRRHNPRPHALPGSHPDQRWAVIRDEGDRIVATGCTEPGNTSAPLIGGIVSDTALRGHGLGAAVTAYLTRDGLDRTGACTLGVFGDNDHARGLYERLGWTTSLRARTGFRTGV